VVEHVANLYLHSVRMCFPAHAREKDLLRQAGSYAQKRWVGGVGKPTRREKNNVIDFNYH
jgi:hypothetical protein